MVVVISQMIVLALGVTVFVLAAWGVFVPDKLVTFVTSTMDRHWGIYVAVIVRLALGIALIIAAPASPVPIVFQVLGAITIVAAVVLALMGRDRIRRFTSWMIEKLSPTTTRLWLLFGMAFGGFLVYGVL